MGLQSRKYRELFQKVLDSFFLRADPSRMILNGVKLRENYLKIEGTEFNLKNFDNIYVASVGKCSYRMIRGIKEILKERSHSDIIISADEHEEFDDMKFFLKGDHPYPGRNSLKAGEKFLDFLSSVKKNDLLIALISGGASSLLIAPPLRISMEEINIIYKRLIKSGATIKEMNSVRKHLSLIKGGLSAQKIYPAKVINLIISDTPDCSPSTVGSGLFAWDDTSYKDALDVLNRYSLINLIPSKAVEYLEMGAAGRIEETPTSDSPLVLSNSFFTLGDNRRVLEGIKEDLVSAGINTHIVSSCDSGEIRAKVLKFADLLKSVIKKRSLFKPPLILLSGGEYSVRVEGNGAGGRNMEFILQLLRELKDIKSNFFAFSFGSDGIDGPTDAAGAWIDENSFNESIRYIDYPIDVYLQENNSYTFFSKIHHLIKTGRTGTNVMDIRGFFIP